MKIEIKHRWNGSILFSCEAMNMRAAVELAIRSSANLRCADLTSANLTSANLRYANLTSADLGYANLTHADLWYANLTHADLGYANLTYADLGYADLTSANLTYANLTSADLGYANLTSADLGYAKGINKDRCTPLRILLDQPGQIRAYKLVTAEYKSPVRTSEAITYRIGGEYCVDDANGDESEHCAAGINLATLDWCMREYKDGWRIVVAEFSAADIAAIPTATDGKFRVRRCTIVGEKNLVEIGLVKP